MPPEGDVIFIGRHKPGLQEDAVRLRYGGIIPRLHVLFKLLVS